MDTNRIKKFARGARRKLTTQIASRLDYVLGHDDAYLRAYGREKSIIEKRLESKGREQLLEEVAYTWFNRFAALRYMDTKGYFTLRIVTPAPGETQPQLLAELKAGRFPAEIESIRKEINDYLDGRIQAAEPEREAYKVALLAWCNAMGDILPFLFTRVEDWLALLLPTDLLSKDSIISDFQSGMTDEDCRDVEIIGWLYQFYISEKKDQVIGKVVKPEDIPAATQLFTPKWIVKYMVQNTLGAQWLATYPDSPLREQMEYYIVPAEQTEEVKAQLAAITPDSLDPEEITLMDPACGSGHILVEAYEIFKAIYLERGYNRQDIPRLIIEKNLYGLDIDERAAQLASFALLATARRDDPEIFLRDARMNILALRSSENLRVETLNKTIDVHNYGLVSSDLHEIVKAFLQSGTYGSLIQIPDDVSTKLSKLSALAARRETDLILQDDLLLLSRLSDQARLLSMKYDAVVTNPPYLGRKYYNPELLEYLSENYNTSVANLFSVFMQRARTFTKEHRRYSLITLHNWMFLSDWTIFRQNFVLRNDLVHMLHLGSQAFPEISGEVVQATAFAVRVSTIGDWQTLCDRRVKGNSEEKRLAQLSGRTGRYRLNVRNAFSAIEGIPFLYWFTEDARSIFSLHPPLLKVAKPRAGLSTGDNPTFMRFWHEVGICTIGFGYEDVGQTADSADRWYPCSSGGDTRRWYGNHDMVVDWQHDGRRIRSFTDSRGKLRSRPQNTRFYFKKGVSWNKLGSSRFCSRCKELGFVFDDTARSAFPGEESDCLSLLAFLNSAVTQRIISALNPSMSFTNWDVSRLPIICLPESVEIAQKLVSVAKSDWDIYEHSWDFQFNPLMSQIQEKRSNLGENYRDWVLGNHQTITDAKSLEERNNLIFIDAYSLRHELTSGVPINQITLTVNPAYRYGGNLTEVQQSERFRQDTMKELVSYAVGCIMGRYSIDMPGLILANAGDTLKEYLSQVPVPRFMPDEDAVLPVTAEDDFEDDLPNRVKEFIRVAFGEEHYDENIRFFEDGLGYDVKAYILRHFYKDHVKYYKTRPIYWMVSSPSGAFRCLIYLHRYTQDTVGTILSKYLRPYRLKLEARREQYPHITASPTGPSSEKAKAQKAIDTIGTMLQELETWERDVVYPIAQERIALDLDDGVKVNYGKLGTILEKVKGLNG